MMLIISSNQTTRSRRCSNTHNYVNSFTSSTTHSNTVAVAAAFQCASYNKTAVHSRMVSKQALDNKNTHNTHTAIHMYNSVNKHSSNHGLPHNANLNPNSSSNLTLILMNKLTNLTNLNPVYLSVVYWNLCSGIYSLTTKNCNKIPAPQIYIQIS